MHCDECDGMGMVRMAGGRGMTACGCVARRKTEQALKRAQLPKRYQDATLAEFESAGRDRSIAAALMMGKRYIEEYTPTGANNGLLFTGSVGTGKTHIAAAILRTLVVEKGARGVFVDFRDLLKSVQATFNGGSGVNEAQVLAPVLEADVVVLDELGAMRSTEWVADAIEHILNTRYNADKATIITTNYPMRGPGVIHEVSSGATGYERRASVREETLGDRIGARMFSRLSEMCRIVSMSGEDYRQRAVAVMASMARETYRERAAQVAQ